jgi:putative oxidoreductase
LDRILLLKRIQLTPNDATHIKNCYDNSAATLRCRQEFLDTWIQLLYRRPLARWAPIPLRLIVGYGFMQHGVAKLSKGPDAFATILHALNVPAPHLMVWFTILIELFGG